MAHKKTPPVSDYVCHYCQRELTSLTATRDHVVPRSKGGVDVKWNRVWADRDCNSAKADYWPDEWKYACDCNFCRRTMRRHWENYSIRNPKKDVS